MKLITLLCVESRTFAFAVCLSLFTGCRCTHKPFPTQLSYLVLPPMPLTIHRHFAALGFPLRAIFFVVLASVLLVGCVPKRQYDDTLTAKQNAERVAAEARTAMEKQKQDVAALGLKLQKTEEDVQSLRRDTANVYPLYRRIKATNADLNALYEKTVAQSNALAASASSERRTISETLTLKEQQLAEREASYNKAQLELLAAQRVLLEKENAMNKAQAEATRLQAEASRLQGENAKSQAENAKSQADISKSQAEAGALKADLSQSKSTLAEREQRVKDLEAAIATQKAQSDALRDKLSTALAGYSSSELTVTQRDGKVYVSLSQELLFASGSTEVNKKGRDAVTSLASVLARNPDIQITVEGHTDNVPFKGTGGIKDNWDLSTIRATTIARILASNAVDARRITAAGRGDNVPVADNSTAGGRAQNRRTEIILSPKLDDLYNIIKK